MKKLLLFIGLLIGLLAGNIHSVLAQAVTGVSLDKHTMNLVRGTHELLTATITPVDAANKNLIWTSSNQDIIYISDWGNNEGMASASHDGVATIVVKTEDGGFIDSCVVTCQVDTATNINAFSFSGEFHDVNIDEDSKLVRAFIPHELDPANLTVNSYQISPGASIAPLPETVHDYTDTVSFVITAPDGKVQRTWKVVAEHMPDLSSAQKVEIDFSMAPQGWIGDTVSWVESNIYFHISNPNPADTSWPPSASVGENEDHIMSIGLFPARLYFYLQDTAKVIVAAEMNIHENCGTDCTEVGFSGDVSMSMHPPKMTRSYYFFNLSTVRATQGMMSSYESMFSGITFWIANKDGSVNHQPVADAGSDQIVHAKDTVQLNGSNSFDPDSDVMSFLWTAPQGISMSSANAVSPSFIAPNSMDTLRLTFTLTVSDGSATNEDKVVITVLPTNKIPVANAGPNQTVAESDSVHFDGTASFDADGDPLTYLWLAPGGIHLTDSTSATPAFKAPDVQQSTTFSFALIVNDGLVNSVMDTVFITVNNVNHRPIAWIDPADFYGYEGDTTYVYGHYSYDPDGDPITYHWWAQSGSQIRFLDSTEMDPRIVLPRVEKDTVFEVYIYVNDGQLNSEVDTAYVHITNRNLPPVAVLQKHTTPVNDGDTVYLDGSASYDPDGDSLTYYWLGLQSVYIYREGDSAWFVAPTVTKPTPYVFVLRVEDGTNTSADAYDTVWVQHVNKKPIAIAGYPINLYEGDSSYLYGSLSYDNDGDKLSYSWEVPTGFWIADSTNPDSRFSAPQVLQDTTFSLVLRVFDGQLWSDSDTCKVTVLNKNQAPVAKIVPTEMAFYGVSVNEGDTLWIDGSPSYDPDGDSITYDWALPKAFNFYHPDSVKVMIIAPAVDKTTSFDAALFVSDGTLRSEDPFIIQVLNVNQAPVADAGKSFSALEGTAVSLNASGSRDPDGDALQYTWTAPDGITLDDVHSVSPQFVAPDVAEETTFTFYLTVSDGKLSSEQTSVEVTVSPIEAVLRVAPMLNGEAIPTKDYRVSLYQHNDSHWEKRAVQSYFEGNETCFAVEPGEWMISVEPVSDSSGFVITFSHDANYWSENNATMVNAGDDIRVEVNCTPTPLYPVGAGYITGVIYRDTTSGQAIKNVVYQTNEAQDMPTAENVAIYLYRSSDDVLLGSRNTAADGSFKFDQLANGTYYLLVQLPGFDVNTPWDVEVNDVNSQVDNINFVVDEKKGTVTDVEMNQLVKLTIYPNPVHSQLNIQLSEQPDASGATMELYDLTGKRLVRKTVFEKSVRLDVSYLKQGVYLLRITQKGQLTIQKIVKQ